LLELGPTTEPFAKNEARTFIDCQVLPLYDKPTEEKAAKFFQELQIRMLTPLKGTMMFMAVMDMFTTTDITQ
jgi:hypothetical protein